MRKRQDAPGELERVRAFVNTADIEAKNDTFAEPDGLAAWLVADGLAPGGLSVSDRDLERAVEVREAMRAVLLAHNGHGASAQAGRTLDDAACRAKLQLRFDERGAARLEPEADGVAGALGRLLIIVHGAIADGTWERLKACRLDSCQWVFYDHTKNHSGAWCTMDVCGNRAKARAYRGRQAATGDAR
jgi:predicted RNA-binding Zn ribbon-like protein